MKKMLLLGLCLLFLLPVVSAGGTLTKWYGADDAALTAWGSMGDSDGTHRSGYMYNFTADASLTNLSVIQIGGKDISSAANTGCDLRVGIMNDTGGGAPDYSNQAWFDYVDVGVPSEWSGDPDVMHWTNATFTDGIQGFTPGDTYYVIMDASTCSLDGTLGNGINGAASTGQKLWGHYGTANAGHALDTWLDDEGAFAIYNWAAGGGPGSPYDDQVKVFVRDWYNNSYIVGANVTLSNGLSNLTNVNGYAVFDANGTFSYNVTSPLYFTAFSTINATNATDGYINMTGAFPKLFGLDVEGANVSTFNVTSPFTYNETSNGHINLLLPPNKSTVVNGSAAGYFGVSLNLTTTPQDAGSYNLSGFYQRTLKVNATNAFTGALISNFTGWAYHNETGYNYSFSDDSGTAYVNVTFGNYTVYIDVFGYSLSSANYQYPVLNATSENLTFSLYSENSIRFYIYDEDTNELINTSTTTVGITGNGTYQEETTDNGTLYVDGLIDGNFSIEFENENYTTRTYDVTVADRSTQQLNVYLTPAGNVATFTARDNDNSQTLEDVNFIMERLINGTYTTVENKDTDVTGRVQFSYSTGVKYRFTVTHPDYETKVFELDPIIFDSYTIRLNRVLTIDEEFGLFDVTITYYTDHYPKWFLNNDNTTFTINFGSADGSLETYGFSISYPGGSNESAGANAIGETFLATFPITSASPSDRVNLTYWYDSVFGDNRTYSASWVIEGAAGNGTIFKASDNDEGLGTLEMILIAVIVTLLVAGLLTLIGSPLVGIMGGTVVLGFFVYIGFLSIWVVIPSFFVGMLIFMGRSSE